MNRMPPAVEMDVVVGPKSEMVRFRSNALKPIRPDPHLFDHLSLHAKLVSLEEVAETIPVDQVDCDRAVTGGLL